MLRHHEGSGRRTVVPVDWDTHASPVAESAMTGTVNLRRPGGTSTFNGSTTNVTAFPAFATNVPARIEALGAGSVPPSDAVDEQIRVIGYRVSIPRVVTDAQLKEGLIVEIVTCGDATLVGQTMHCNDVARGEHLFERALYCDLNET